jgi:hypothetical protein
MKLAYEILYSCNAIYFFNLLLLCIYFLSKIYEEFF